MTDPLSTVFANMDRWRHLPAYQLERRADIFFSAYLPAVVAAHTGVAVSPDVIPELPIRRDLIWPDTPSRQSVKVDYAMLAADRSRVFFVELKTDAGSRRDSQDHYLARSVEIGFPAIVQGIVDIAGVTAARGKYGHLLAALARHGLVHLPDGLADHLWPRPRPGVTRLLRQVTVTDADLPIHVVYVQPTAADVDDCIDFEEVARHVEQHADPLSRRFAASLRAWTSPAGVEVPPA